jgi:SAM-dependent methyltransferase
MLIRRYSYMLWAALAGSVALPAVAVFARLLSREKHTQAGIWIIWGVYVVLAIFVVAAVPFFLQSFQDYVAIEAREQAGYLDTIELRNMKLAIAASAGLSLLLELSFIRWQASAFEFFAFYKNYGLLSCFAGLGLGYTLSRSREGIPLLLVIPLFIWQAVLLMMLRFGLPAGGLQTLETIPFREQLNMGTATATPVQAVAIYLLLSVVFILTALTFVPVGQLCGRLMNRTAKLSAYGMNLLGSLAGVLFMFLLSFLWTPPVTWFAACFLLLLFFVARKKRSLLFGASSAVLALAVLSWPTDVLWHRVYSPYQLLEFGYADNGLLLLRAAGQYYQRVYDFSIQSIEGSAKAKIRDYYELPYRIQGHPVDVAVVGAGTGNDVAAALRAGARHVDAVEIDPVILAAGKADHPEKPYDNDRVRPILDDARSFLRNTPRSYDLIVYGLLDSHTLLSQASSVRLDSFVYTIEGLREARARLKPGGMISLSFSVINDQLGRKIFVMLQQAFDGQDPVCIWAEYDGSVIFLERNSSSLEISPGALATGQFEDKTAFFRSLNVKTDVSTDDWPFFYMPKRVYPVSYLVMLGLILALSIVLTVSFSGVKPDPSDTPFFFLGAGFMLVETKAITELGLSFGNTWQVTAISIAGILSMAFLANLAVQKTTGKSVYLPYLALIASLVFGLWISYSTSLPSTLLGRIEATLLLTCPVFFSGIVFSRLLASRGEISNIMSLNLLGALCGGVLEYNSMYFGFRFLYLLALGLYMAALLVSLVVRVPVSSLRSSLLPTSPRD